MSKKSGNIVQVLGSLAGIALSVAAIVIDDKSTEEKMRKRNQERERLERELDRQRRFKYENDRLMDNLDRIRNKTNYERDIRMMDSSKLKYHTDKVYIEIKGNRMYKYLLNDITLYEYIYKSLAKENTDELEVLLDRYVNDGYTKRSILREVKFYIKFNLNR